MAGVLPGVEAARRRGFHPNNRNAGGATASKRLSLCLYVNNNLEFHFNSHSSEKRNPARCTESEDQMLDEATRKAKERLDQRLHRKSEIRRKPEGKEAPGSAEGRVKSESYLQSNLYKLFSKSGSTKLLN